MKITMSKARVFALLAPLATIAVGCGPSPAFEPQSAVPEGAVVVPNARSGGISCGLESKLRSRLGRETKLRITNDTGAPMNLYWLDYAGARRSFGSLGPGESALKLTYAGHVWIGTDVAGRCEGAAVATEGLSEFRVGSARAATPPPPAAAAPASGELLGSP
jgi:hypothetical protein